MDADRAALVIQGQPLVYVPDGEVFRVLCSCPSSMPRRHTVAAVRKSPQDYRLPTLEELHGYYGRKGTGTTGRV